MTTFLQLQNALRFRLKETATDSDTEGRLKECINIAYLEVSQLRPWNFMRINDAVIAGSGVREYAIDAAADRVINVRVGTESYGSGSTKLNKIPRDIMIINPNTSSTATSYCLSKDGYIEVDVVVAAGTNIYYDYIKVVSELSADGDEAIIPSKFIYVLKQLAYFYALDADDDTRASRAFDMYKVMLGSVIKNDFFNGDEFDVMREGDNE